MFVKVFACSALVVLLAAAFSESKPFEEHDRVKKDVEKSLPTLDEKTNNTGNAPKSMSMDLSRTAFYPVSGGYGYHTIGQRMASIPHYPNGWAMPQSSSPYSLPMRQQPENEFEEEENPDAKHKKVKPIFIQQYHQPQYHQQAYAIPVALVHQQPSYHYVQSYQHATPYYGSYGGHYRSAERDEQEGLTDGLMAGEQTAQNPPMYYSTKYLLEKPESAIEQDQYAQQAPVQPQMMRTMSGTPIMMRQPAMMMEEREDQSQTVPTQMVLIKSQSEMPRALFMDRELKPTSDEEAYILASQGQARDADAAQNFNVMPSSFGYPSLNDLNRRNIVIDDKYQMKIMPNYLLDRIHRLTPAEVLEQRAAAAAAFAGRSAAPEEEPKPWESTWNNFDASAATAWSNNQQPSVQQPTLENAGSRNFEIKNSQFQPQDPYVATGDKIYMEPFYMPEGQQQAPSAKAAEEEMMMMATYPNMRQQMRDAQMQLYFDNMNAAAAQLEPLAREYANERGMALAKLNETKEKSAQESWRSNDMEGKIRRILELIKMQKPGAENSNMERSAEEDAAKKTIKELKKDDSTKIATTEKIKDTNKSELKPNQEKSAEPMVASVFAAQSKNRNSS